MERENQDLALEQIRVKAAEYRTTVLESIRSPPPLRLTLPSVFRPTDALFFLSLLLPPSPYRSPSSQVLPKKPRRMYSFMSLLHHSNSVHLYKAKEIKAKNTTIIQRK